VNVSRVGAAPVRKRSLCDDAMMREVFDTCERSLPDGRGSDRVFLITNIEQMRWVAGSEAKRMALHARHPGRWQ